MTEHTWSMIPYTGSGFYWILALVALPILLVGYFLYSAGHTTFVISPEGLRIRGDIYGRFVPAAKLQPAAARAVDLTVDRDMALGWKKNGLGMSGYKSGWFSLKGGGSALVIVTDQNRVVAVPTLDGYTILLSVADPAGFIRDLQSTVATPPPR